MIKEKETYQAPVLEELDSVLEWQFVRGDFFEGEGEISGPADNEPGMNDGL
jgi:hypothetical protein